MVDPYKRRFELASRVADIFFQKLFEFQVIVEFLQKFFPMIKFIQSLQEGGVSFEISKRYR